MLKSRTFAAGLTRSPPRWARNSDRPRRRLLRRQEHRSADRGAARRRLRHLCTGAGAPLRPPHPGPADHRVEEHAGRRQRASGGLHQLDRAQGRHRDRRHHAGRRHGTAARRKGRGAVRPDQGQLSRHRQQRHARLRVAQGVRRSRRSTTRSRRKSRSAASPPTIPPATTAIMHKHTAGAQYDVVTGYSGTAEIALAMERGEIDGACGWDWSSFKSQRPRLDPGRQGQSCFCRWASSRMRSSPAWACPPYSNM